MNIDDLWYRYALSIVSILIDRIPSFDIDIRFFQMPQFKGLLCCDPFFGQVYRRHGIFSISIGA